MHPGLCEPDLLEIKPYKSRLVRIGDVVFFTRPGIAHPLVHRVVGIAPSGIGTRGDNNTRDDDLLLQPDNIIGRVVAAWRGNLRRRIAGGFRACMKSRWHRWRLLISRRVARFLGPLTSVLGNMGWIARRMPASLRPRVFVFHTQARDSYRLLSGQQEIGRYDHQKGEWLIKPPFRITFDERILPTMSGS